MKPSVAYAIRALASKIHPPLPLNPRESQQLLTALTTSFRQQLDKEHSRNDTLTRENIIGLKEKQSSIARTHHHLDSILTDPLFSHGKRSTRLLRRKSVPSFRSSESNTQTLENPILHFEKQAAQGHGTLELAIQCLSAERERIVRCFVGPINEGLAASKAGEMVMKWLRATGSLHNTPWIEKRPLLDSLIPFVVAEQKTVELWTWFCLPQLEALDWKFADLAMPRRGEPLSQTAQTLLETRSILLNVVGECSKVDSNFDQAIRYIVLVDSWSRLAAAKMNTEPRLTLFRSWFRRLLGKPCRIIARAVVRRGTWIQPRSMDVLKRLLVTLHGPRSLPVAWIHLHPQNDFNATHALALLRQSKERRESSKDSVLLNPSISPKQHVRFYLDTAKALLDQGNIHDASWVMALVQEDFPDYLPPASSSSQNSLAGEPSPSQRLEEVSVEKSHLEALAGLSLSRR